MKKIVLVLMFVWTNAVYAQTTMEKIDKTTQKINGALEGLGGLFKKKDKDGQATATTSSSTARVGSGGIYQIGSVTKNTKYIECDYLEAFNKGAALIRKGTQYALIDKDANFIVPYGKFTGISTNLTTFSDKFPGSGFFYATFFENNAEKRCIINAQGKIIGLLGDDGLSNFSMSPNKDFLIYTVPNQTKGTSNTYIQLIDFNGKSYPITKDPSWRVANDAFRDSTLVYSQSVNNKTLYGCKDIYNNVILKPTYDLMRPFSDGVAIVGKYNSLNQMRYGIIDKKGKPLVQPSYENEPSKFQTGLASIRSSEDLIAFITKTGKVVYKTKNSAWIKNGRIYEHYAIIDTLGNTTSLIDFLKQFRISTKAAPGQEGYSSFRDGYPDNEDQMKVNVFRAITSSTSEVSFMATYNFSTATMVYMPRVVNAANFEKDNVSGLIHIIIEANQSKTDGYVNTKGEFVIIKKPTANAGL